MDYLRQRFRRRTGLVTKCLTLGAFLCLCAIVAEAQFHSIANEKTDEKFVSTDPLDAWLQWRNGDELRGKIGQEAEGEVRWIAKPFASPLSLTTPQLKGVRFASSNRVPADKLEKAAFRLKLLNHDVIDGELVAIEGDSIRFRSPAFPDILTIPRESVQSLINLNNRQFQFSGPGELQKWATSGRDRRLSDWFTDLRGEFSTYQWSGNLFRGFSLPEKVEVHFKAVFPDGTPNFEIGLLNDPVNGPMLETWDDQLVLTHRSSFVPVQKLTGESRIIEMRLLWNQTTGDLRLCTPSGKQMARLTNAISPAADNKRSSDPNRRGFHILNRTPEMKLSFLTIREWDGKPLPPIDLSKPRITLTGSSKSYPLSRIEKKENSNSIRNSGQTFSISELREITFNPPSTEDGKTETEDTRIAWYAGSSVSGTFNSLSKEQLSLKPDWSAGTIQASLRDAREIRFPDGQEMVQKGNDLLTSSALSLRGSTKTADVGAPEGSLLAWLPPGAVEAVPFDPAAKAKILRSEQTAGDSLQGHIGQSRLHLTNGEVVTGNLATIADGQIAFQSRITGPLTIPQDSVRAIEIGMAARMLTGFGDSEWEAFTDEPGDVEVDGDKVIMQDGSFGNPSILLGDQIHFEAMWKRSYGALTLRLFASSEKQGTPSTDVVLLAQGNRLFVGKLKPGGAFSFSNNQVPITDNKASVTIEAGRKKVEILINGKSAFSQTVDPENVSGNGLYFRIGGGWQGWNQAESSIEISDFRIEQTPGVIPQQIFDPRALTNTLTIPRALRNEIPTHALVAPNGDLLRGKLLGATKDVINFSSGIETFEFPRSRVSSIVALEPPSPDESTETPESNAIPDEEAPVDPFAAENYESLQQFNFKVTHQLVLQDGTRLQLQGLRSSGNEFIGKSGILGDCTIPIEIFHEVTRSPEIPIHKAPSIDLALFKDWKLELTPDPVIADGEETPISPLIGKPAPPVELTMLDEKKFSLKNQKGRIVVLDFWATWCGPCIKALPGVVAAVDAFPEGTVAFCAVNQGESPPIIEDFLKKRDMPNLPVGMDFTMKVGNSYGVEGIPHTVVIGKDGKVAWVHTGYTEELKRELFEVISKLLIGQKP